MGYSPFVKEIVFEQIVWIFAQCDCVVFHIAGDEIRTRKKTLEKFNVAITSHPQGFYFLQQLCAAFVFCPSLNWRWRSSIRSFV